ncbi:MAG: hypothetical protein KF819_03510 [Labilithrix sp.]|nr:hypothetical protein [Labilithrix sp.]
MLAAGRAEAYHEGEERLVDSTAHTLRAREARIGIWDIEYGPVAFATVGTDTAPWIASFFVDSVVVNGHAKVRLLRTEPLTLSVMAAAYHTQLPASGPLVAGGGSLLLVPISVFASSDLTPSASLHLGITYADATLGGSPPESSPLRESTAIAASALQLHAIGEYRVSRVVAVVVRLHGQAYATPMTFDNSAIDERGKRSQFVGAIEPVNRTNVAAVAGVAVSGSHFNVRVGLGYGALFLPSMGIKLPIETVIPELDAYVRF